jgi:tripartite-type tricarboxylate transporter receptor subunit TctC
MSMHRTTKFRALAAACAVLPLAGHAADAYPGKQITIVVGYAAGGGNDVIARIVAEKMAADFKRPVVVENQPGVASILAAGNVAHAKPDGYTLFWGASGPISYNPGLYSKLPYEISDFKPISLVGTFPLVLVATQSEPIHSVKDLVAFSQQHPEHANYGASAASFQLVSELFNSRTGAKFTRIPYKGTNESAQAVMAGTVTMAFIDPGPAITATQGHRAIALAVTSPKRVDFLPDLPTLKEQGVDLEVSLWGGLLAPAATPPEVIDALHKEIVRVVADPEIKKKLLAVGTVAQSSTPDEFQKMIDVEVALWTKVAHDNHISAD